MSYIFISYSHEDKEYAHRLEGELKSQSFETWLDDRIDYGAQWPKKIEEKIDGCKALILIMTVHSYESDWVQNELYRARRKQKNIFPLLLEGDEPWLSVETTQYVDVRDGKLPPEDFFDTIAKVAPRKAAATPTTKTASSQIPVKTQRDQKINEIVKGLDNLVHEKWNYINNPAVHYQLSVGECKVTHTGLMDVLGGWPDVIKNASNTYFAVLFLEKSDVHDETHSFLEEAVDKLELIDKLINLGWSDNRLAFDSPSISLMPIKDRPPKPTLIKRWEQGTDLVAIANFLIDTNGYLSTSHSDIKVNLQIE